MGCLCKNISKKNKKPLAIETMLNHPPPIPTWPKGEGFATGSIDLGGLQVCQVSTFKKIWATHEGGPDNLGATFYEPSSIPKGYIMLGCYSQPNKKPLFGWVLAGKDVTNDPLEGALEMPIDYTLVWSSKSLKIKKDGNGYIWLPMPPEGYKSVGYVVTNSPEKPSLNKIRCVRYDLTESSEVDSNKWIWGPGKKRKCNKLNIFGTRPNQRGAQALGVGVGTFIVQKRRSANSLACLKNSNANLATMPNLDQIKAVVEAYSPWVYFHPNEQYLPSSVNWFFKNGALLYKKGEETKPIPIEPTGLNLPQRGSNDGAFWLDLPIDESKREKVKKGDLQSVEVYLNVKPALGATFTDIAIWVFYPFNGPGKIKVGCIFSLKKTGRHVGDWEHVTLRISNFNGELRTVYFSQHSGGEWVDASELHFENGNKPVIYASLHGHAFYPKPRERRPRCIGAINDTAKSKNLMDTGDRFSVVGAPEYLFQESVEPPWLNYNRQWGPKTMVGVAKVVKKLLPKKMKSKFEECVKSHHSVLLSEEGPTGPKMKGSWNGDEMVKKT